MRTELLQTKLYVPPVRSDLVPRPRLIEKLNAGLDGKLNLVSAPAGFGKTTLVSAWVGQTEMPVAWVSLDEQDNDLTRFLTFFIAALQTVQTGYGELALGLLQSSQPPPAETILTGLINELTEVTSSIAMVIDDYQVITNHAIHESVAFLLDHLPAQIHLNFSSRIDPPWPLARLRARRELTELRANDLRFIPDEATTFLNDVMGLELSKDDVTIMESRTEGWIVGLQMAALSMQGQKDKSGFIRAFTGSHRFILDYLVEEILNQQPPTIQEFLLKTSILERLSASLCDTVTGGDESQRILTRLEKANLFLVPLDDERRWYRYHHLFADLLHSRLEQTQPDLVPALHHRASDWYEHRGLTAEAVNHMLAAGDTEQVARLVEGNALTMMDRGELTTLAGWLGALPDEAVRSRPWLCVAYAWVLAYTGQVNAVESLLQDAERAIARSNPANGGFDEDTRSRAETQRLTGHVAATRAYATAVSGDMPRAEKFAREAMAKLPQRDLTARGVALALLGSALRWRGDLSAATHAFAEAVAISQVAGISHVTVAALCNLAALQTMQGQLHKAVATCRDTLRLTADYYEHGTLQFPVIGLAYARLSFVLREWNDLESALRYAEEGLELCKQWGQTDILITGYLNLARVYQAVGDSGSVLSTIRDATRVASTESIPYRVQVAALEAQLQLAQGNPAAAFRWARDRGLKIDDELKYQQIGEYIVLARVLIAQGKGESLTLLARLLEIFETSGAIGHAIEILVLQAVFLHEQGENDQALIALERALSLAQPEDYVRTFIDEGAPMGKLLRQAAMQGIAGEYTARLLAALEKETKDGQHIPQMMPQIMVDPLSERELEVLRLLTTHLSNTEIASELYISANTVRFHVKNIYNKLNVHRRTDAVQRAEELGLV